MIMIGIYLVVTMAILALFLIAIAARGLVYNRPGEICIGILGSVILWTLFFLSVEEYHEPKAIDVYQGKTTLGYTVKDGIVIDSVVVWKGGMRNGDQ